MAGEPQTEFPKKEKPNNLTRKELIAEFFAYLEKQINWNRIPYENSTPFDHTMHTNFWSNLSQMRSAVNWKEEFFKYFNDNSPVFDYRRLPSVSDIYNSNELLSYFQSDSKGYDQWFIYRLILFYTKNSLLTIQHIFDQERYSTIIQEFNRVNTGSLSAEQGKIWVNFALLLLKSYRIQQDSPSFDELKKKSCGFH